MTLKLDSTVGTRPDPPVMPMLYMSNGARVAYGKSGMARNPDISAYLKLNELFGQFDNVTERREEGIDQLMSLYPEMSLREAQSAWNGFVDWKNSSVYPTKSSVEKAESMPDQNLLSRLYSQYRPYFSGKAILAATQALKANRFDVAAQKFEEARDGFEKSKNPKEWEILESWRVYSEQQGGQAKSLPGMIADSLFNSFVVDQYGMRQICPDCADEMVAKGIRLVSLGDLIEKATEAKKESGHFGKQDPGLFTRCVDYMSKRPGVTNPQGLCAKIHKKIVGHWPAQDSKSE